MKILVIGGTGKVGAEVVKELQKRQTDLRLLVRKSGTPTPPGVEVAAGDLLDPVSLERAMHGVDKLYLLNAVSPDELTQALIAYDLAKKLKLKHIVYHSVFRVEHFKDVPHFASKLAVESALREFEVPFTIIRPNYFIQNDASLEEPLMKAGIYPMPLGDVGISVVDIRDIAEATAVVLTSEGNDGLTYNLNGPEPLSGPTAASIWSKLLGKEIRYTGHDMNAFEEQMRKSAPSWSAFDIRMMFQGYLERGFVAEKGDIEKLTKLLGHAPRSYDDFAAETAAVWKKRIP
ncbi:MAG: NmrA family NAD(P)-binding protein [Candidatus Acidiferrum sp.]